jgi:hypothetical protein
MPINRLLADSKLAREDVERLKLAYSFTLRSLSVVDRNDPLAETIARKVIEVGATVHDPDEIAKTTVKLLGIT